ncbi:glycosyltransferase 25 family member [Hyposmocoma kahamanoa]|uniref:glycosyltransferase 25 family member n=1 Tax=Hyposmocoma kahamanoa TaxID=1477025 RepID=UPI000E6D7471|nr:glycosyltransferase 25 family member [Hyposmocoma kahamanoa]
MDSNRTGYEYPDETEIGQWTENHMEHVIELREKALVFARESGADYLLMIDSDVYLTNPESLTTLVAKNLEICAPMLQTDGYYSNFWCGMTEDYYYKRTEDYSQILFREITGCFSVPMIHTCVLINLTLKTSDLLTYDPKKAESYDGPTDDIITFAVNAQNIGMKRYICNDIQYGFTQTPPTKHDKEVNFIEVEKKNLLNLKMELVTSGTPLPLDDDLEIYVQYPSPGSYRLDETYVLNLERRPERRRLMELSLKELGLKYKMFKAIDYKELTPQIIHDLHIHVMPKYEDPYHKRPMKLGEIGCFLSHYYIWRRVVLNGYRRVLVLEDDINFVPNFKEEFSEFMDNLERIFAWDFVYIGRKVLYDEELSESRNIVRPRYSYWTLGYIISSLGAQKLINAQPLKKLLPVDEFIPIMFDEHPNATWKSHFKYRNLIAYSASPLLVYPTHFTGQDGYISDTEGSIIHDVHTEDSDNDEDEMSKLAFQASSITTYGDADPLNINDRFYEPKTTNESYMSWNHNLYKTEL